MKFLPLGLTLLLLRCSSGDPTVSNSSLTNFDGNTNNTLTYYETIESNTEFNGQINIALVRQLSTSEDDTKSIATSLSASAQFYKDTTIDATPDRNDVDSCTQYLTSEELTTAQAAATSDEITKPSEILVGEILLTSENATISLPYTIYYVQSGLAARGYSTFNSTTGELTLDGSEFSGAGETFSISTDTNVSYCQEKNRCAPAFTRANAFIFPNNFTLNNGPQAFTENSFIMVSPSDFTLTWDANTSIFDAPQLIDFTLEMLTNDTFEFASYTNCTILDDGNFTPGSEPDTLNTQINNLFSSTEGDSIGTFTFTRKSVQSFDLPNGGSTTVIIDIIDAVTAKITLP